MFVSRIVKAGSDLAVCVVNLLDCYNTIVYLLVLLVLFILSMEFLPSFLVIPVIMSFLVIKVLLAMKKQDLDLKGAIKDNIVLVLLTGLFVFLAILNIFDK